MRCFSATRLAALLMSGLLLPACSTFHSSLSSTRFEAPNPRTPAMQSEEALSSSPATGIAFDWPVDHARMTRGFLPHQHRPHLGLDLAAPKGTPILASRAGTVIYTGREFHGYGRMILIECGDGWATLYAHLDKILVAEGQKVRQGEVLGKMGRTGRATGVHLHFEIRKNRGPVDPLPLLPNGDKIAQMINH